PVSRDRMILSAPTASHDPEQVSVDDLSALVFHSRPPSPAPSRARRLSTQRSTSLRAFLCISVLLMPQKTHRHAFATSRHLAASFAATPARRRAISAHSISSG